MIINELALVHAAIWTCQNALSRLLALTKVTDVRGSIREGFLAFAVRVLVEPLAFVKGAVWVLTDAFAIHEVVDPVALVLCAVLMNVGSVTFPLALHPVAEVVRLIDLLAEAESVLLMVCHLAHVY